MDAPWQIGHKTPYEYGRVALEAAKAMRRVDPSIELVACGSSNSRMRTFGEWEATVLEEAYEAIDYITLHNYYEDVEGDLESFLASSDSMDEFIRTVVATCDHIKGKVGSKKRLQLSFDEWNVWHQTEFHKGDDTRIPWRDAPDLAEDVYSTAEAVVVGSLLISLLNHADRVRMACLAQLVNTIAPITTLEGGRAWRQTTFFPFADVASRAHGEALRVHVTSPTHATAKYGEVDSVVAAATYDAENRDLVLFLVNRSTDWTATLDLHLGGSLAGYHPVEHRVLQSSDPHAKNTRTAPDTVAPRHVTVGDTIALQPISWNVLRLQP
jgi:alpha-N-arabinofuranosidase